VKLKISNTSIFVFSLFLYLSLIVGFLYNENLNYGSYGDWINSNLEPIKDFSNNFFETFLNYDEYGHRHSPIYLIFLSIFLDLGFTIDVVRIIHLHLSILLIIFFYKCLKLNFDTIDSKYLALLSLVIFLSPTYRSLSIWPDTRIPGLLFFVLTIYFFLKFKKTDNFRYTWFTCICLIVSSYISPNFSIFFPYFFFFFLKKFRLSKLSLLILFNFLAALPIFYYIFILDVNFLTAGKTPGLDGEAISLSFNFSNKLMIISSIIFFHLSPVLLNNKFHKSFFQFLFKKVIILMTLTVVLAYFFNYQTAFTGGGIFYNLSHFLFDNDYIFFIVAFFSIGFIYYLSTLDLNNFFLFALLIISNLQNTIYHKYYEPLVIIMFFTLFSNVDAENFLKKKINLVYIYILSIIYILARLYKNQYLV
tara:strand:+ start:364 stop:1620 length:1257 start_codon:yes stop_codon:yes gene_type:complete